MKRALHIISIYYAFTALVGCGDAKTGVGSTNAANEASVHDLRVLMENHPEISRASLKHIKDSALGHGGGIHERTFSQKGGTDNLPPTSSLFMMRLGEDTPADPAPVTNPEGAGNTPLPPAHEPAPLDPKIAQQAQALIDKALDEFDFALQFNAGIKIAGIQFNQMKIEYEKYMQLAKDIDAHGMNSLLKGKMDFGDDKFSGGFDKSAPAEKMEIPTCEEFVKNPYLQLSKDRLTEAMNANKANIKKSLSGCAHIRGAEFAQCLTDYNSLFALINEHATCSINSLMDFEKTMDEVTNKRFGELDKSVNRCMSEHFKACGYTQEKLGDSNNPGNLVGSERPANRENPAGF